MRMSLDRPACWPTRRLRFPEPAWRLSYRFACCLVESRDFQLPRAHGGCSSAGLSGSRSVELGRGDSAHSTSQKIFKKLRCAAHRTAIAILSSAKAEPGFTEQGSRLRKQDDSYTIFSLPSIGNYGIAVRLRGSGDMCSIIVDLQIFAN